MRSFLSESPVKRLLFAFGAYQVFFLSLFAQYPLQRALPGNCDTLLVIAVANIYLTKIAAFLGFGASGTTMFPAGALGYGEASPMIGAFFLVFKLLGFDDVNAYYLLISALFSLNAIAVFVFSGLFVKSFPARLFAGFAVACSNVMFSHIDDAFVWLFFLPLLALTFFIRAIREQNPPLAYIGAILGGLQFYLSVYVSLYQSILLVTFAAYLWAARRERLPWPVFGKAAAIYVTLMLPPLLFYSWAKLRLNMVSPWEPAAITRALSLNYTDVVRALPNNLIYGKEFKQFWSVLRHQNLIGLGILAAAVLAFFRKGEHRVVFSVMFVMGILLALGPGVMDGSKQLGPSPIYPLYEWFPILSYLRVPVRGYFLTILAVSVLAAVTLDFLVLKFSKPWVPAIFVLFFFGFQVLENVPFPLRAYKLGSYLEISPEYKAFFAGKTEKVILDLPSGLGFAYDNWDYDLFSNPYAFLYANDEMPKLRAADVSTVLLSYQDVYKYNRDIIYMNWQTQHRQNIIGGVHGYFPAPRLIFERWTQDLPANFAIRWLKEQKVDFIAYHREMLLPGDADILPELEASPLLRKVAGGNRTILFEIIAEEHP